MIELKPGLTFLIYGLKEDVPQWVYQRQNWPRLAPTSGEFCTFAFGVKAILTKCTS